jgi:Tol biopolymer transport system component
MDQTSMIWVADARGHNARATAPGRGPVWSPDGKRLAFWGGLRADLSYSKEQQLQAAEIQVLDVARNATVTLARSDDLLRLSRQNLDHTQQGIVIGDIAWSPDGTMLALTIAQEGSSAVLLILNADDGAIRARVAANTETSLAGWDWIGLSLRQAWSPDSRYVSFRVMSGATWYSESGAVVVLDTRTGQHISLPCAGEWAWQSSGQWLAVPQRPSGMLLVTPDLSEMHWLNTPASFSVAWRPGS